MALEPEVYDDKFLEIINSLQIPISLEEQLGIGTTDLLSPAWNLPGGREGGIYPLMPGMEYAPTMASTPIVAPPVAPPTPPEVVIDDPVFDPDDPGPISSAPIDRLPPAAGGTGPVSIPGFDPEMGWTLEFIDKVRSGEIDFTDPQYGVPFGEGPGALENLSNWLENRDPDITLNLDPTKFWTPKTLDDFLNNTDAVNYRGDPYPNWLDPDFDWGNPDDITPNLQPVPVDRWLSGGELPEIYFDPDPDVEGGWKPKWDSLEDVLADTDPGTGTQPSDYAGKIAKVLASPFLSGLPFGNELLAKAIEGGIGGIQNLLGRIPGIGDWFVPGGGIANLLHNTLGGGGLGGFLRNRPIFGGGGRGPLSWLRNLRDRDKPKVEGEGYAGGGISGYPRVNALIEGPGTEKSDDIKAMLSDGEFVTNAAALRGIGRLTGADPKDKEEQRRMGAREMYRLQHAGEKAAGVTT